MKLVKGLTAAVVALAVAAPCAAFAANVIYYDADTTRVTYSVDKTEGVASVVVTEVADLNNTVYVNNVYGDGTTIDGFFRMTDTAPSGEYAVSIVPDSGTEALLYFRHINATSAEPVVAQLRTAAGATAMDDIIKVPANMSALGIDPVFYAAHTADITEFLYRLKTASMTVSEFWKNYGYSVLLTETKAQAEAVVTAKIIENAQLLGYDANAYAGYAQDVKDAVATRFSLGTFTGTDFKATAKEWLALARINDAESVEEYQNLLFTEYSSFFTLTTDNYEASSYKEEIIRDMMGRDYTTKTELEADFVVQSAKERGNGGGGGGSPSSGNEQENPVVIPADPSVIETSLLKDIGGHWAETTINDLYKKGIVSGSEGNFYPNNNITRAEFCTLIVKAFYEGKTGATAEFYDVNPDNWYYTYVGFLSSKGLVSGMGDGTFGAGRYITRQDMAAIVARVLGDLGKSTAATREMATFTDAADIASYSADAVEMLYKAGVISGYGDGSFMPTANLTKAEAATVIYKLLNK